MTKRLVVKGRATKKKRIANAPHWTHAGTIAARRRALDELHTNRQFRNEVASHRLLEHVRNLEGERNRLQSIRGLERPEMQFYRERRDNLAGLIAQNAPQVAALRHRPYM